MLQTPEDVFHRKVLYVHLPVVNTLTLSIAAQFSITSEYMSETGTLLSPSALDTISQLSFMFNFSPEATITVRHISLPPQAFYQVCLFQISLLYPF